MAQETNTTEPFITTTPSITTSTITRSGLPEVQEHGSKGRITVELHERQKHAVILTRICNYCVKKKVFCCISGYSDITLETKTKKIVTKNRDIFLLI
jgi:hypothetical protein